ncbi:hypothetical protein I4U23_017045 [Adineta vaga]|nr:hypothetical protein I4U23_017045 [Adineta vaga]
MDIEQNVNHNQPSFDSLFFGAVMPTLSSTVGRTTAAIMPSLSLPGVDVHIRGKVLLMIDDNENNDSIYSSNNLLQNKDDCSKTVTAETQEFIISDSLMKNKKRKCHGNRKLQHFKRKCRARGLSEEQITSLVQTKDHTISEQSLSLPSTLTPIEVIDRRLKEFVCLHHIDLLRTVNYQVNKLKDEIYEKQLFKQLTFYYLTADQFEAIHHLTAIRTKQLKVFEQLTMFEQRILCHE